ncbi:LysR family transcriptional regulator [Bradyrhizobium oligotrophicum]|uniref:LysR family transcriptional regulator n=1 Tax=Bradyrhizobium oligotrophicum TaxID=44255 RepID=UPI003EB7AEE8
MPVLEAYSFIMRINIAPQQLAAFIVVAETCSFSEAAGRLAMSQPALSRLIRLIEDTLGTRLFDRDTRNVTLTPAGRELLPIAQRIVREFDSSFSDLARFVSGQRGRISIATLPSIAAVLLPGAIARFRAKRPDVDFHILDALSGTAQEAVLRGEAEIGLTAQPQPDRSLSFAPLLSDEFGVVCRRDDVLAQLGSTTWDVFASRPFIAMAAGTSVRAITDAAFLQIGLAVAPLLECSFLATARALVNSRLGITALPGLTVPLMAETGLVWRPLVSPSFRRPLGIIRRAGSSLTPAALEFIGYLHTEVRQREKETAGGSAIHSEASEAPTE